MPSKKYKQTKEHREKISEALKGHPMYKSIERSKKLSKSLMGRPSPRKGVKLSEETKAKMSISLTGRKMSKEFCLKLGNRMRGKPGYWANKKRPMSEETKLKISIANKRRFIGHIYKTDESKICRKSREYRIWRNKVFERDDWTCKKCNIKSGCGYRVELHPHHIKNFAQYTELRFDVNNGITFCEKCHKKFHKKYGKNNNNKEQMKDFIKSIKC